MQRGSDVLAQSSSDEEQPAATPAPRPPQGTAKLSGKKKKARKSKTPEPGRGPPPKVEEDLDALLESLNIDQVSPAVSGSIIGVLTTGKLKH